MASPNGFIRLKARWAASTGAALLCTSLLQAPTVAQGQSPGSTVAAVESASPFDYQEVMVPMRDGVRLQTIIMRPKSAQGPLPILLRRTPYGVPAKPYLKMPADISALAADGYIFVIQNVRGRFKSEGKFALTDAGYVDPGQGTLDTRDGWDTVDWLVKHVPGNNGKVGIYGVSYDGGTAAATLLAPHPALKAVSEQAAPVDEWMNDDFHRYGAFRLSYGFEYSVLEEADRNANTFFNFDTWDTYSWYLKAGSLSDLDQRYLRARVPFWSEVAQHPNYDQYWQERAWLKSLKRTTVPTLNVAGFWDQEDPWGPWQIFRHAGMQGSDNQQLVAGPWNHGGWRRAATQLGPLALGEDTGESFRKTIEAPFFAYWLHGKGARENWKVATFQTGSNRWERYASWPPKGTANVSLYLTDDGRLDRRPPDCSEKCFRQYVSDPANPVPYRPRPISPTYPGGDWPDWESMDQRFADNRPDVLTYATLPLAEDLTVTGELKAEIFMSTTGSDADLIVKLIDVLPENAEVPKWSPDRGPPPGGFAASANGYELPIAMEVRRGRFLAGNETPTPLKPDVVARWDVPLRDRDHVFKKGHRIMVQLQSSWFPLIDRNPQMFVPNIFNAKPGDFTVSTNKVFSSKSAASRIVLSVKK